MPVTHLPERCDSCGLRWRTLFDTFVNGLGWRKRCGGCAIPQEQGAPRAYLGPYPITKHRTHNAPCLHVVGDARP